MGTEILHPDPETVAIGFTQQKRPQRISIGSGGGLGSVEQFCNINIGHGIEFVCGSF
jgi:hypothetical protein